VKGPRAATITSLLIAALAVGSTALVVLTRQKPTTAETEQRAKNLLPVWREAEVKRIELRGATTIVLEREADDGGQPRWRIAEPLREPADADGVERLIAALGFAAPLRAGAADLAAAGVAPASPRIVVQMGAMRYELALGKKAEPPSGARHVSVVAEGGPGSRLAVIPEETAKLFATTLDELRRRELWPHGPSSLRELVLEGQGRKLELIKGASGRFTLRGGQRVNRDVVDPLLAALVNLDLQRFLEPAAAKEALASGPRWRVRGVPGEGAPVELELGGSCPQTENAVVAARVGGVAGCVDAAITKRLDPSADELLDRRPFTLRPDEVEELRLEHRGKKLVLARSGSSFVLRAPSEAQVTLDAGNARLAALCGAVGTIVEQPDLARLGLEPAQGSVTLTSPGDGKAFDETVTLGKPGTDGALPIRRADGAVVSLPKETARAFNVDGTLLRGLEPISRPPTCKASAWVRSRRRRSCATRPVTSRSPSRPASRSTARSPPISLSSSARSRRCAGPRTATTAASDSSRLSRWPKSPFAPATRGRAARSS
jgi:hypothetical protein